MKIITSKGWKQVKESQSGEDMASTALDFLNPFNTNLIPQLNKNRNMWGNQYGRGGRQNKHMRFLSYIDRYGQDPITREYIAKAIEAARMNPNKSKQIALDCINQIINDPNTSNKSKEDAKFQTNKVQLS